jgi:acyl carrier protein
MVPGAFVFLEALPLTASGKVNRKALPEPERSGADEAGYIAPRTPTEKIVAGIWAEVLGLERVGMRDEFFQIGGHSLLAMRVVSRVRQALDIELPVRELFAASTVESIAVILDTLLRLHKPDTAAMDQKDSEEFVV